MFTLHQLLRQQPAVTPASAALVTRVQTATPPLTRPQVTSAAVARLSSAALLNKYFCAMLLVSAGGHRLLHKRPTSAAKSTEGQQANAACCARTCTLALTRLSTTRSSPPGVSNRPCKQAMQAIAQLSIPNHLLNRGKQQT